MLSLLANAETHGACLAVLSLVDSISCTKSELRNICVNVEGVKNFCNTVINCAGLHADLLTRSIYSLCGSSLSGENPELFSVHNAKKTNQYQRQYYAKGNYFRLEGQTNPFNHLVYPVPVKGGLGVHATIDMGHQVRFGPDVQWISTDVTNPGEIDLGVSSSRITDFYAEVHKYWPNLKDGALAPDYAGIR